MQKTTYVMRISDWSSDACSSELRLPGRRNDPLRRLFRSGLGCRKGKLRLFGNMRITRLESLESRTTQSRAQPINQSRDFHFTDTAALQIQLRWGKRFGSRPAQSHQLEAKARIARLIVPLNPIPKHNTNR